MDTREVPTAVLAPASMPLERIEAEITELAGHMAAAECRWLQLVAEFDDRLGYEQWGSRTCAHWLSWHCSLDVRSAREKLRVAHALCRLPLVREEFAAGRLSYSKVRALTRIANPENEAALVGLARHATAAQVERSVRAYRGVLSREEEIDRANRNHEDRYFRGDWGDDGALVLNGRLTADAGAVVLRAIEVLRRSGAAANNADALLLMAESVLASGPVARKGNERALVVINVDADVLAEDDTGGVCEIDGGPAVAPETARRLACDGSIVWMLHDDTGRVINVSPKVPSIPVALRRAVHARDQGCDFPGCGERSFTDVHHIRHREHGGLNELTNLVELCWHHHRLVHEGGWAVFRDESGVITAVDPAGEILGPPSRPGGSAGGVAASNRARGVVVTPTSVVSRWLGDPLHVNDVIAALWSIDRRGN
jgi:hypothetical protein